MCLFVTQCIHVLTLQNVVISTFAVRRDNTTSDAFTDRVGSDVQHLRKLRNVVNHFLSVNETP